MTNPPLRLIPNDAPTGRDRAAGRPAKGRARGIADEVARLHAQGLGRNAIARRLGCSPSTVTKAGALTGVVFDASAARVATQVAQETAKAKRARLALRVLDEAESALDAMAGADARDRRDLAVAAGIMMDKNLRLEQADADTGLDGVVGMLDGVFEGLRQLADSGALNIADPESPETDEDAVG